MATVFAFIANLAAAIPIVNIWIEQFVVWYVEQRIASMKQENSEVIKKAVLSQDQRDLEKVMGNPNAGEPTHLPGTVVRDTLPGVSK